MPYRVTLDDEVMSKVHESAEPWVDSPNSALRKLLDMDPGPTDPTYFDIQRLEDEDVLTNRDGESAGPVGTAREEARRPRRRRTSKSRRRNRAPKGSLLDERAYWRPVLEVLANSPSGAAPARNVIAQVGALLDDKLRPLDKEPLNSGGLRWHTRVMFARFRMKEAGLLKQDSPRGVWEISDRGREALKDGQLLAVATD
jgi:Mrr N-terminal domain